MMVSISDMEVKLSFAKAQDLLRLTQIAASRWGGVSLEDICAGYDIHAHWRISTTGWMLFR
ncbi:hypothetical protein JCM17844_29740 [Iodidimonas gelatinilytica]|uniref:Uncharacterized protein n=1 Tax=Iodidimonas gelatinilytica TaxID=1236966 RepID=A0A5A7MTQ6_9PROT|nr:hypothetical protein JCM17844_29740 [Iodidimonas gelatinilytica]